MAAACVFSVRPGLVLAAAAGPPTAGGLRPPGGRARRGYGDYCFRATCPMTDAQGCAVGKFTGYDVKPSIGQTTLAACRLELGSMPGGPAAGYRCDPEPQVVFLSHATLECTGQVFFERGSSTRRVV